MHRLDVRTLAALSTLGLLAACGGSAEDPGPGTGGSDTSSGAAGASSAGTSSNVAGTTTSSGGSSSAQGGAPGVAGTGVANGGTGVSTGGTGSSTAGTAPVGGSANGGSANGGSANGGTTSGGTTSGGSASATDLWIAPNGADSNPGTEAAPLATVGAALPKVKPGITIWLKPGTYKSTATIDIIFKYSGTAAQPVKLFAAPGGRPLLDFTGQVVGNDDARGINLVANYWHIKGIELKKTGDNCIGIAGSYNIIENVITHECGDTGIQITAPSSQATDDSRAANNQILNCDSWGNIDTATGGENADGFAAKLRIGPGNVFKGCRAWNNADDGWDFFAADDVVTIESSWAFSNGKAIGGSNPAGDGNGFKLGGAPNGEGQGGAVHIVNNSFAFENKACGFVRNNNPDVPKLTKCGAKSNGKDAYCSLSVSGEVSMTMSASAAISAARNADGSLPAMK